MKLNGSMQLEDRKVESFLGEIHWIYMIADVETLLQICSSGLMKNGVFG